MHGEVQARCREEVCSSAVCWLVARCSRFRTRCSLLSPPSSDVMPMSGCSDVMSISLVVPVRLLQG